MHDRGEIIDQRIFYYIQDAVSKGYPIGQIRQHLIDNKFPERDVDEAIQYFYSIQQAQLKAYADNMYRMGYNPEMVRQGLLRQGYPSEVIEKVISGQTINVKHEVHVAGKTFLALFLLIIFVGGGFYAFNYTDIFKGMKSSDVLLDVSIGTDTEYVLGQDVRYQVVITSMGATERFDAKIIYTIIDSSGDVKRSYSETIAVDTKASSTGRMSLPSTVEPGRYSIRAVAEYAGKTAESTAEFFIVEQSSGITYDEYPLDPDSGTVSTGTGSTGQTPTSSTRTPFSESLAIIRQQAGARNDVLASSNCEKFSGEQKDICYSTVADASNKVSYCDKISSISIKDNCYLGFVIGGNTQICEKITDEYSKNYCKQADIVNQMQQAYLKNDTALILALSEKFEPNIYSNIPPPPDTTQIYAQPSTISIEQLVYVEEE